MCYERRSYHEAKKAGAEPKPQAAERDELVRRLMQDAQQVRERAKPEAPAAKEPAPAK